MDKRPVSFTKICLKRKKEKLPINKVSFENKYKIAYLKNDLSDSTSKTIASYSFNLGT